MPSKASDRLGPAPAYLGLGFDRALEFARHRRDGYVIVGAGGHCFSYDDLVLYSRRIAVAFDKRGRSGTVIAAERVSPYWETGT
jgi:hypothetical protein